MPIISSRFKCNSICATILFVHAAVVFAIYSKSARREWNIYTFACGVKKLDLTGNYLEFNHILSDFLFIINYSVSFVKAFKVAFCF